MSITIKTQFESAVTIANEDIFEKSYIENGVTIIEYDVRKRDFNRKFGVNGEIKWCKETYAIDIDELSTVYSPIKYRFIMARGYYYNEEGVRIFFTPEIKEAATTQHVSDSVIRISCFLAVICGVSLRNISKILSGLFLISITKSSIKRWIDDIGQNLPSDKNILEELLKIHKSEECHIDGYYPMGTNNCVMVIKDEQNRILITHEADSENKDEAIKFLKKIKDAGIKITTAYSDYSSSFIGAIKKVFPKVKFQADHFHTVKNIWKSLKKALLEYRRKVKEEKTDKNSEKINDEIESLASKLWDLRWLLLKKPCNLSESEKRKIYELNKNDKNGFIKQFRSILSKIVSIFDKSKTETSAKKKLKRLQDQIKPTENKHYNKIIKFFNNHWNQAMQYLKKSKKDYIGCKETQSQILKRASNSETGMRLLRRLEKNHDGIRSASTRKNYIKIFQHIKYLSADVASYIDKSVIRGST